MGDFLYDFVRLEMVPSALLILQPSAHSQEILAT